MTNFESKLKEAAHDKVRRVLSNYMSDKDLSLDAPSYSEITELVVDTVVKELSSADSYKPSKTQSEWEELAQFYEKGIEQGLDFQVQLNYVIEIQNQFYALQAANAKILLLERENKEAIEVIKKYKDIAWATGNKMTREESMAAQTFLSTLTKSKGAV